MKLHNHIMTLALCTAITACGDSDKEQLTPSQMAGRTLDFTAMLSNSTTENLDQGDQVGITMWDEVNGTTYTLNQKLVATENGTLVGEESVIYPTSAQSLSVFAYMPYRSDWNSNVNYRRVEVYADQSSYENYHASDFLIGQPVGGNPITSTSVKLNFEHVMSRINIELTDPTEGVGLATAAVKITNVLTSAFVNPYTGEVSTIEGERGSVLTYRTLGAKTRSNRRETMSAIIPAQTIEAGESFIEINLNATKYKFVLPDQLIVGNSSDYNYSLELSGGALKLVSSSVTKWNDGGDTDIYVDRDEITPDPTQKGYDIYLCLGEGNMAGRATISASMYGEIEGAWLLNDRDSFEIASNPINRYSSIREELSLQRLSPAYNFARTMYKTTGRRVGLVCNARGNTTIAQWQKGAAQGYYDEAVRRARAAMAFGTLHGIIWHQGCSDCTGDMDDYRSQLTKMIRDLRTDLGVDTLPVVVGQIATWNWVGTEAGTTPFNDMIKALPDSIAHTACASSTRLTPWIDESDRHFSTESQLTLGERYASGMLSLEGYK